MRQQAICQVQIQLMDAVSLVKLLSALIYPVGAMAWLGILYFLGRLFDWDRIRAISAWCFFLVFIGSSNPWLANTLAKSLERQYPQKNMAHYSQHDAIVILGGGLRLPSSPASEVQLGARSDRYWYATQLYRAGKAKQIFIAAGNAYAQTDLLGEAVYAKQLLSKWGVPERAIVVEAQSRTTEQNRDNIAVLLERRKVRSILLVTSALHMPRSMELFASLPLQITPASADVLVRYEKRPSWTRWLPSSSSIDLSTRALHEYYGIWFNRARAWFK